MKFFYLSIVVLISTSCSSVITRSKMSGETRYKENFIYYTGTRVNYEVLTNQSEKQLFLRYALGIPDLPLSMILDTVLVPLDFIVYQKEKARGEVPLTLMESIKKDAGDMLVLLKKKDYSEFQTIYVDTSEVQTSLFDVDLKNLDDTSGETVIYCLDKLSQSSFTGPSYERAGRLYFKGDDYLISIRQTGGIWKVCTLSMELNGF